MLDSAERRVREPMRTSGSRADFWYRMSGTENTSSWSVREGEGGGGYGAHHVHERVQGGLLVQDEWDGEHQQLVCEG